MDDVTLIDNFLDNKSFLEINDKIMNDAFPWFWSEAIVRDDEQSSNLVENYQLTHVFYSDNQLREQC